MDATTTLIGIILSVVIFKISQWIYTRHKKLGLLKKYKIPGPEPSFLTGNLYDLKREDTPHKIFDSWFKKYGDLFGYYVGEDAYVVTRDRELLKLILIKDFNQFVNRPVVFIDYGPFPKTLIGLKNKRWKEVRSLMTPMFSTGKMKLMADVISRKVDIAMQLISEKAESGQTFDIYSIMQGLTLDVIGACALAMKTNCQRDENDTLRVSMTEMLRLQFNKVLEIGVMFPFLVRIAYYIDVFSAFSKAINLLISHLTNAINERRRIKDVKSVDLLQMLLESSSDRKAENTTNISDEEVISNAFILLLAGYETTAATLAFISQLLMKHPDVQERLHEEIRKAEDSSCKTVQGLPYLEQVFSESLRIFPPVTNFITRVCTEDYQYGSHTIPKGCQVLAPVWDIHHDPDLWPDPWKFDPDRFSPDNKGSIKSMAYLPFGAGPRNCIGVRFAQLVAKTMLFRLLKDYRLESCDKTEDDITLICQTFITQPKGGVWVKVLPRK